MKWLIDAHLPYRAAHVLRAQGEDVLHTLDLPEGNYSTDTAILAFAESDDRIVMTKDSDFVVSFRQKGQPRRLLLVATGNIRNRDLETLLLAALPNLITMFAEYHFIELHPRPTISSALLVIHS